MGGWSRWAGRRVHGAVTRALEDGPVNLAELLFGALVFHADDDAVRVHEVFDRGALAEKLGVGSHP